MKNKLLFSLKKALTIFAIVLTSFSTFGQNAIVGTGFAGAWPGSCNSTSNAVYFTSNIGGTMGSNALIPNGTGNQYWRLGINWDFGFTQYQINNGGTADVGVAPNATYNAVVSCQGNGALFYNVPSTSYRYVFKTLNGGVAPTGTWVFFEIQGDVREITSVSQMPNAGAVAVNQPVAITANLDGTLSIGQDVYLRYTTNNYTNSTVVKMTGSGATYNATIPGQTAGTIVSYYLFTSGASNVNTDGSNADLYTINWDNNGGPNYLYVAQNKAVSVSSSGGITLALYNSVKNAFDAINAGTHTGTITITMFNNSTNIDKGILNNSGIGSANYSNVSLNANGYTIDENLQIDGNLQLASNLTFASSKGLEINGTLDLGGFQLVGTASNTLYLYANSILKTANAGGFHAALNNFNYLINTNSTVEYTGTNQTISYSAIGDYYNIHLKNGGTKTLGNATLVKIDNNLTIDTDVTLEVAASEVLTVGNVLTNNGTVNFANNASLIQINDVENVGNIVYNRTSPLTVNPSDYVYWSAPVTGQTLSGGQNYVWNNAAGTTGGWATATTMNAGQGVIIKGVGSKTFTGVPFNGDVTVDVFRRDNLAEQTDLLSDNWNLIGNPYPSAINAIEFLTDVDNTNIEGEVALWTHNSPLSSANASPFYANYTYNYSPEDYIYYNNLGGQTGPGGFGGNIAAGQAFFVKMIDGATASSSSVKFKNSMRTNPSGAGYNNAQFYRTATTASTTTEEKHRIWLDLVKANAQSSRIVVGYATNATNGKDRMYDASTSFSSTKMRMYSLIEDTKIAIQGRALPFNTNDLVPLGFNAPQTGNFAIAIHAVDGLFENQDIYLEDTQLNTIHDLKQAPYSFSVTTTGENNTRFKVRYTSSTLGNGDFDPTNEVLIASQNELKAIATAEQIASIAVFDLLGRSIFAKTSINATEFTVPIERVNAPLLIKVQLSSGEVVNKKVMY